MTSMPAHPRPAGSAMPPESAASSPGVADGDRDDRAVDEVGQIHGVDQVAEILTAVGQGVFPPMDGRIRVVSPSPRTRPAVLAFSGSVLIAADVEQDWVDDQIPDGDLSAASSPTFLSALGRRLRADGGDVSAGIGRPVNDVHNVDMVMLATAADGDPPLRLSEDVSAGDHPRAVRARQYRSEVRVFTVPGGLLTLGRGVGGRWETSFEVDPDQQGQGLGRALAASVRYLVPAGEVVWAQVTPGNAAAVRVLLAAGYVPVGAEALFLRSDPSD